jgi:hypothetical protein
MGEKCSWKDDTMDVVVVVMLVMMMMIFIDESQNINSIATFLELQSAGDRAV